MIILLYIILIVLVVAPFYLVSTVRKMAELKKLEEWKANQKFATLEISVPRNNDKAPLAAEQMFASLHGIYSDKAIAQPRLSFEIVARDKYIQFFVYLPEELKDFVMGQIYAQYPTVEIKESEDYTVRIEPSEVNFAACELTMTKPDVYPIKLFGDFEVDPLSGITSVISKLGKEEEVWLQMILRPVGDEWQEKGNSIISAVRSGKKLGTKGFFNSFLGSAGNFGKLVLNQAIRPGVEMEVKTSEVKLPGTVEEALKGIEFKILKLGFESKMRVLSIADDSVTARIKCQNVVAAFKQFNTTHLNGFKIGDVSINDREKWQEFCSRKFDDKGNILNISELASIYHLPHETVSTPSIVWSGSKKGEPPSNLPIKENTSAEDLTVIGKTNFRNIFDEFGIKKDDRRRHVYIIGKSGTGKSTLIENMACDDVIEGRGVIVVDPHGELADKVLSCVPDQRIHDVVVFDPADRGFPIAFNLLEHVDDDFKGMVASGFVGIFKKIFGDSWGPRLEHILRNTVLALLDFPESTMLDIPKMLTDNHFRDKVVEKVKDPVIKEFWVNEFASYDSKFRTEAVSPILNKVGQFLSTSTIRNIVGQPHSKIDIREIMDQQKIMIVNLSRGKIGEDNSALLGAMIITKIQLAAMSRADITADKRPDCFLYVDEFQNFATDSFAVILSEARKYNLCLTMANQYIDQMPEQVRSAVFGNAGTIISFRVGGNDAAFLVKEFEPIFDANDLVNLDKYQIYIKLLINGISSPAFSACTLPPISKLSGNGRTVLEYSRKMYSNDRSVVEAAIAERARQEEEEAKAEAELFKQGGLEALLVKKGLPPKQVQDGNISLLKVNGRDQSEIKAFSPEKKIVGENQTVEISAPTIPVTDTSIGMESQVSEELKIKKKKKRVFRYQNVIGNSLYKEQTGRSGVKWYLGETIDSEKLGESGLEISETASRMVDLARKAAGLDLPPLPVGKPWKNQQDDTLPEAKSRSKDEDKNEVNELDNKQNEIETGESALENIAREVPAVGLDLQSDLPVISPGSFPVEAAEDQPFVIPEQGITVQNSDVSIVSTKTGNLANTNEEQEQSNSLTQNKAQALNEGEEVTF